jgi:hypothetical protein
LIITDVYFMYRNLLLMHSVWKKFWKAAAVLVSFFQNVFSYEKYRNHNIVCWSIWFDIGLYSYSEFYGFVLRKWDYLFRVNFDHFWIELNFLRQLVQYQRVGSSLKLNHHRQIQLTWIGETHYIGKHIFEWTTEEL